MKVGTAPKIIVSVIALIGLIFIGFIGVRQINGPTVEERVYCHRGRMVTPRPQSSPEELAAQTDSTQDVEVQDNQPQIAAAESAAGNGVNRRFLRSTRRNRYGTIHNGTRNLI